MDKTCLNCKHSGFTSEFQCSWQPTTLVFPKSVSDETQFAYQAFIANYKSGPIYKDRPWRECSRWEANNETES